MLTQCLCAISTAISPLFRAMVGCVCVFFSRSVRKFGMHACISVYIFAHSEYQETLIRLYGNRYYAVMIHACVVLFAFYSHGGWKFNLKINTNVYFV